MTSAGRGLTDPRLVALIRGVFCPCNAISPNIILSTVYGREDIVQEI